MNNLKDYDVYIFDYEGTLSEATNKRLTLKKLLYEYDFRKLGPNKKICDFINLLKDKEIYVVGIVECNKEIKQKNEWLKIYFPMIEEENCIFISSDYKKSDVIKQIVEKNNYDKNKILFVDDKISHIEDVKSVGIKSVLVEEIK